MTVIHFSDKYLGFSDLDIINDKGINQAEVDFSEVIDEILFIKPD